MTVSFVIPAHNEERFVGRCLKSIKEELARDGAHAEIIVVNNASTDRTKQVALAYRGVQVVDEPRKGITRARQAGFLKSAGDLVANIDADTILPPGWLARVRKEFTKHPKLVALSGPFVYYDLPLPARFAVRAFYGMAFVAYLVSNRILKVGAMLQGGNFVARRAALAKIGGFDTDIDFYGEDTDIACRLRRVGEVEFTFRLPMYASGRRFAAEGLLATGARYAVNFIWITVLKRPFTKTSQDVRPRTR